MIKNAKVIKAPAAAAAVPLAAAEGASDRASVLRKVLVEASERAEQVIARAEQRAQELMRDAERARAALLLAARDEGRAAGYADALARLALVARLEAAEDERGLQRSIEIAKILAERLIGGAIATDQATLASLATQVLAEVRGARRIELHVHPADVAVLQEHLAGVLAGLHLVGDSTCARGDFRAVTDIGTIDAKLGNRLDILAAKLSEVLRKDA